jgi:TetR/AcrR family transcriptional regulator, mexJK operon transcriptional repressor
MVEDTMTKAETVAGPTGGTTPRSTRKRQAILEAATEIFLINGYLGTNMDEIAARSAVSKQTVYKHFSSKEALFVEIVSSLTDSTGDRVHGDAPAVDPGNLAAFLEEYAFRQLYIVLNPRIMQLRRLVIGEVPRFPELARVLYERGPLRAIRLLADLFESLKAQGLLDFEEPTVAASHFNWLVMSTPLNQAMLLGDDAIPGPDALRKEARDGVRVFLAAYGK